MLKISGTLRMGKVSDIDFSKVDEYAIKKGVFVLLKSTSKLHANEPQIKIDSVDAANLENEVIEKFEESNPSKYNALVPSLMKALQSERLEDEKVAIFEDRVFSEVKKILEI
jgi:hypothetical protein